MMDYIRTALIAHSETITLNIAGASVSIDNPWAKFTGDLNISVSNTIRIKFWTELVTGGIEFAVDGMKGIAIQGDNFSSISESGINVLNLAVDADEYVRVGSATGSYMVSANNYVAADDYPTNGAKYTTTDVAPEP